MPGLVILVLFEIAHALRAYARHLQCTHTTTLIYRTLERYVEDQENGTI